jgi:hypothetical protein
MENISKAAKSISRRDRAYYRRRNQNRIHIALASFFAEEAAAGRISKKQLAELIEKNPAQITRWLTEASNYEADTISDLLLGMKAEMEHRVVRFSEKGKSNYEHPLVTKIIGKMPEPPKQRSNTHIKSATATSQPSRQEYLIAAE